MKIFTKRVLLLLVMALVLPASFYGQAVFSNEINDSNPGDFNPYTSGQVVNANITASGIGRGPGITVNGGSSRYNAKGWNTADLAADNYFYFTLTPNAGYEIDFDSFMYTGQKSGTGPKYFSIRTSLDNYTTDVYTYSETGDASMTFPELTASLSASTFQGITQAITFRFYAWGATSATGSFSINDFAFNGTVALAALAAPVTAVTDVNATGFTATWNAVPGATGYYLDVSTDPDFSGAVPELDPWINEFHYDNSGTDTGEFVEVVVPNSLLPVLADIKVTLYNQTGGVSYDEKNLSEFTAGTNTGSFTVFYYTYPSNGIQNGDADGIALSVDGSVVQFISYEGTLTASDGDATGMASTDVGVSEPTSTPAGNSLMLTGTGTGYSDFTWSGPDVASPGSVNPGQTLEVPAGVPNFVTGYQNLDVGNVLIYNVTGLEANVTYYYRVRAYNSTSVSTDSTTTPVTTSCPVVALPTANGQLFCGAATVASLAVTTGEMTKWYASETAVDALADDTVVETGTYYVSQTVNGCESERVAVEIVVNPVPDAPAITSQLFCGTATTADLPLGNGLIWYTTLTGDNYLAVDAELSTGTYYVSQIINGCQSERIAVSVTVNPVPDAPVVPAQLFCGSAMPAELPIGPGMIWYTDAEGTIPLATDAELSTGTYYASQIVLGCESAVTAVSVTVNPVPDAPVVANQSFCGSATAMDLPVDSGYIWYTDAQGTEILAVNATLTTGVYYVSQIVMGCPSALVAVDVTVTPLEMPTGDIMQDFTEGQTLADLDVTGVNIMWYADGALSQPLDATTPLVDNNTYYAVSVNGDCVSEPFAVTTNLVLARAEFELSALAYYPNPVSDVLTISYQQEIASVDVYNLLGQTVLAQPVNNREANINMAGLAEGTYMVKVVSGTTTTMVKVLKK
ncbi:Ig-like domain-containing protein [Flavobacterium rhizosphaerae]|uniref:T9SS type A sorting domain-containing protein n=1 Tax=Flavobacterium rhizosphaerae TaxID=3163298 RepID=A0ABW8YX93_9FLAO